MKLLHLSDLHLGKRVNEVSILDDQNYILHQILEITDAEHPDAVVIAGDVYDKSVPSGEAVTLFDWFLVALAKRRVPVLLISGNHDSPERLAFGNRLLDTSGIHISPVYTGGNSASTPCVRTTILSEEDWGDTVSTASFSGSTLTSAPLLFFVSQSASSRMNRSRAIRTPAARRSRR